ncbi:MAG TPA: ABC transporter permease [Chryseosolibacter sp.]|nr:ABC transporter permease [Chryseosolibacter sp.]
MIKSYLKIAWRTIEKNRVYSTINVFGLALGICACLMIYTITSHELSFDSFHADKDRIFRIVTETELDGQRWSTNSVAAAAPAAIRDEVTGIEAVTAFHYHYSKVSVPNGNNPPKRFAASRQQVVIADAQYFEVFSYEWLAGGPATLNKPFTVVLTRKRAREYFGDLSADLYLGKEVMYDTIRATITGIVEDWTGNTDFPMSDFISLPTINSSHLKNQIRLDDWKYHQHSSQGFVKLGPDQSADQVAVKLRKLATKYDPNRQNEKNGLYQLKLQPLREIHFNPHYEASPTLLPSLYALMALAFFILVLACINFVNLATAQSLQRAKEISIRKVLGSRRSHLIGQMLSETFLLTLFGTFVAILMVDPLLSAFSTFLPANVQFHPFSQSTVIFLVVLAAGTSLLAGIYPAYASTAYLPVAGLKGTSTQNTSRQWWIRKMLIVFQFAVSFFFVVSTLVIGNQVQFIRTKDKGFNTARVVLFRSPSENNTPILVEQLRSLNGVENAIIQGTSPMGFAVMMSPFEFKTGTTIVTTTASLKGAGEDYVPFYNIRLLAGRNILNGDSLKELVINKSFSEALGFKDPSDVIGKMLYFQGKPYPVVGVVDNFHERSFYEAMSPVAIGDFPMGWKSGIALRLTSGLDKHQESEVLTEVGKLYRRFYPDELFQSRLVEDEIDMMHQSERKTATLMNVAMIVTIFVSCMGVFGLALFTARTRTKEIGIRKVLGASVSGIVRLLSKDMMRLVGIAIVIAAPVAWYYNDQWLQKFAYHIDMNVGHYLLAACGALAIAFLSISFQTVKAALANPVDSLKDE